MATRPEPVPTFDVAARTRLSQIIVGALLTGAFTLIMVAALIPTQTRKGQAVGPLLIAGVPAMTALVYVAAPLCAIISFFVPKTVVAGIRKQRLGLKPEDDPPAMLAAFQAQLITSSAILQGAGNVAAISYLIEHQFPTLAIAIAVMVAIALKFPTTRSVENWVDDQCGRLAEERIFNV